MNEILKFFTDNLIDVVIVIEVTITLNFYLLFKNKTIPEMDKKINEKINDSSVRILEELNRIAFTRLSYPQAQRLLDFYFEYVKNALYKKIDFIFTNSKFEEDLETLGEEGILSNLNSQTSEVVSEIRSKFNVFRLINNQNFDLFLKEGSPFKSKDFLLDSTNNNLNDNSQEKIKEYIQSMLRREQDKKPENLVKLFRNELEIISQNSKLALSERLDKIYGES